MTDITQDEHGTVTYTAGNDVELDIATFLPRFDAEAAGAGIFYPIWRWHRRSTTTRNQRKRWRKRMNR